MLLPWRSAVRSPLPPSRGFWVRSYIAINGLCLFWYQYVSILNSRVRNTKNLQSSSLLDYFLTITIEMVYEFVRLETVQRETENGFQEMDQEPIDLMSAWESTSATGWGRWNLSGRSALLLKESKSTVIKGNTMKNIYMYINQLCTNWVHLQ